MTDKDQFPEPDGRDDRTIFRPASARADAAPEMTRIAAFADERTIFRPNPAGRRPQAGPAPRDGATPPRKAAVQGVELAAPDPNPILRAASPLLLLLGRLRAALARAPGGGLTAQVAAAVEQCDRAMVAAGVPREDADAAKFALCASADDVLANLPGDDRGGARQPSLTTRFFGENNGGRRFFGEIDKLKTEPRAHYHLLELYHACLGLLYAGARPGAATSAGSVATLRTELAALLQANGPAPPLALSPHWRGQPLASHAVGLRIPLWTVAGVIGLVLFGSFLWFRLTLSHRAEATAEALGALNPATAVEIGRKAAVAPPPAPPPTPAQASQLDHIRAVLAPNIAAGTLSVEPSANQIVIRIVDRDLFQPGKSAILEDVKPLMTYIAMALDDDKGSVKVVGHSDNTPISNARFASNFELSLERAKAVGALLKQALTHPERIDIEGKGADAPIAPNDTPEGRAKNRRVEIVVPRSD